MSPFLSFPRLMHYDSEALDKRLRIHPLRGCLGMRLEVDHIRVRRCVTAGWMGARVNLESAPTRRRIVLSSDRTRLLLRSLFSALPSVKDRTLVLQLLPRDIQVAVYLRSISNI